MVKENLLRVHNLADAYGKRPSEIVNLQTVWGAYQFDEACLVVGRRVEKNVNEGKDPFHGFPQGGSPNGKSKFRSAKHLAKRKVKIPTNGIW